MKITHVGTATVLLEVPGYTILTDPALDPAGRHYDFGFGLGSQKTQEPALPPGGLPPIDLVLVSHDHHADNLDLAGRAVLPGARWIVTTRTGARRLGPNAIGLDPGERVVLSPGGRSLRITARPAQHGPPGIALVDDLTIGFLLEWPGQADGALYISGDTVWFGRLERALRGVKVGTAIAHLGAVGFRLTGPLRYTFTAAEAATAARTCHARTIVPVHYDGWSHFRGTRAETDAAFAAAGLTDKVTWLARGEPVEIAD